ncbi:hypothetical protein ACFCX4_24175 [Kitasatospora sp. NPDC056327]|uniref:hypothetical protein n=1 Tax=Kitasatospora sp. NPDC056327 TaxID=3345785 RepID=UPI0035DA3E88
MRLRTLAAALRSVVHLLLPPQEAAALDEALAAALRRRPGRALPELRRLLLLSPPSRDVRRWVLARLGEPGGADSDPVRIPDGRDRDEDDRPGVDDHAVTLWIEERDEDDLRPLDEGQPYTAVLMAAADGPDARYSAEVRAPAAEVPAGGLVTRCVLSSTSVRLEADPRDPGVELSTVEAGDRTQWCAVFPLVVPGDGDSARRRIRMIPVTAPEARLDAFLFVGDDLYRRLAVSIDVRPAPAEDPGPAGDPAPPDTPAPGEPGDAGTDDEWRTEPPVAVLTVGTLPAAHAGVVPSAAWQRPRSHLDITVLSDGTALARCEDFNVFARVQWPATAGGLEAQVANVRGALDRLRQVHGEQLELIPAEQLRADLAGHVPSSEWAADGPAPGEPFASAWAGVARSDELRLLAYEGHQLYRTLFADPELRGYLERLAPGDRLTVNWLEGLTTLVPHVPLPLLHLDPVSPGRPVDPSAFLGLRFRVGWTRRQTRGSRALGDWRRTTRAHLLYEAQDPADAVGAEARRHAEELGRWESALLLTGGEPRTAHLSGFLAAPSPSPVSLLYFYCHCVTGTGGDPRLRFGPTNDAGHVLRRVDMGSDPFADRPVVFVNACGTNESDPLLVNQLMDSFLNREARAYIGTEGRVPPGLAARFATAFFSFLYGTAGTDRAPVGESLAQARRFLWERYRNLGGLFYGYVNDGLLYQADDDHVRRLSAGSTAGEGGNP